MLGVKHCRRPSTHVCDREVSKVFVAPVLHPRPIVLAKQVVGDRKQERPKTGPALEALNGGQAANECVLYQLRHVAICLVDEEAAYGLEVALKQLVSSLSVSTFPPEQELLITLH